MKGEREDKEGKEERDDEESNAGDFKVASNNSIGVEDTIIVQI